MRVLLIFPNPSPFPYHALSPLGVFSLGAYLEQAGVAVEYYDERVQVRGELDAMLAQSPDLIGITAITSFQILRGLKLTAYCRHRCPGAKVAWGGVHPTMCPEQTLSVDGIDYVVMREGEKTLLQLVKTLEQRTEVAVVQGLGWKDSGRVIINEPRPFLEIDTLPFPYSGKALKLLPRYLKPGVSFPTIGYQSSRGCPNRCRYCYNTFFNQCRLRVKSEDKIRDELSRLTELGIERLFFYDDSMGGSRKVIERLNRVLGDFNFRWWGSPRLDCIDEKIIGEFENNGCEWLFFGVESPLPHILEYIQKGLKYEDIERGIDIMCKSSITTTYSLMIGFPKETYQDTLAVLDYADEIARRHPKAETVIQPYAPLPGSSLYAEAVEAGFSPPESLRAWSLFTMDRIHTPWLKKRSLFKNVYLISFLAFRYEHMLGEIKHFRWVFRIAHRLAFWRWRRRFFGLYLEGWLYRRYVGLQFFLSSWGGI